MAASVADLREFLLRRGFPEADANFIAAVADDLRDGATEQALDRVEERVTHFEAIFKERLNGHQTANKHEFREVLSTIREVVANAQTANEKRFSALTERINGLEGQIAELKGEVTGIKGEITGIKGQIEGLKSEMDGMRAELRGWVSQVGFRLALFQVGLAGLILSVLWAAGVFG